MNNCKIVFIANKQAVNIAEKLTIENAVSLALNLHGVSNVSHEIDVFQDTRLACRFTSKIDQNNV